MRCQTLIVVCLVVAAAAEDYGNKLTRVWAVRGAANEGSVINVTSASIVIQPTSYERAPSQRTAKLLYPKYGFKPRAIPLRKDAEDNYYSQEQYKREAIFPGNYKTIPIEKSGDDAYSVDRQFRTQSIPLIRNEEFQKRSLDVQQEPIIERPEEFSENQASRRSISDMFNVEDDDDDEDDGEYEVDDLEDQFEGSDAKGNKRKKPKIKSHGKLKKYMLPLLMAYKMKYFALVPVMIGGLILLVGATGMAGFFFALFAAVMGLQKGGY